MHDDLKQSQREASHARARATESVETLEENLSRALLLVRALTEALVRKGRVTREEVAAVASQLDMLDGRAGGRQAWPGRGHRHHSRAGAAAVDAGVPGEAGKELTSGPLATSPSRQKPLESS